MHTPPFTHIIQPLTPIFSSIILKPIPFIFTFLQPIHLWIPKHHLSSTITQPIYLSNSTSFNPYNHGYSLYTTWTHSILIVNKLFWSICMIFNNSLIRIIQATLILAIFQFSNSVSGFEAIFFFFFKKTSRLLLTVIILIRLNILIITHKYAINILPKKKYTINIIYKKNSLKFL